MLLLAAPQVAAEILVVTDQSRAQREIIAAADQELTVRGHDQRLVPVPPEGLGTTLAASPDARLIVTLGTRAARELSGTLPVPVLHAAIPAAVFSSLEPVGEPHTHPEGHTALFLDQPTARQAAVVRLALPQLQRLGVLTTSADDPLVASLRAAARDEGMDLIDELVPESDLLIPRVDRLLRYADALLVTPDAGLYNRYTLQKVLLAAYRQRKPVIGLSAAYVTAGALLAVHSDPEMIGNDLGAMIDHYLAKGRLPLPRHPRRFAVAVNRQVARSLGLSVPEAQTLTDALRQREARP
jgi:ABC-type uncharacterized transport system substrate-binding protein